MEKLGFEIESDLLHVAWNDVLCTKVDIARPLGYEHDGNAKKQTEWDAALVECKRKAYNATSNNGAD